MVNKRHNNTFDRMKTIQEIAELVDFKSPAHKVDLKTPKITIAIEVIKGLCCISLLPDYFKLKKYNVFELTQKKEEAPAGEETKSDAPADDEKNDENPADESQKANPADEPIDELIAQQVANEPKKDSVDEAKPNESGDVNPDETNIVKASGEQ